MQKEIAYLKSIIGSKIYYFGGEIINPSIEEGTLVSIGINSEDMFAQIVGERPPMDPGEQITDDVTYDFDDDSIEYSVSAENIFASLEDAKSALCARLLSVVERVRGISSPGPAVESKPEGSDDIDEMLTKLVG